MDDIVITGNNSFFIDQFVQQLDKKFSLKDLGSLNNFLGVEIISTTTGLFISQARLITDLLSQYRMEGAKETVTPMSSSTRLTHRDGSGTVDSTPYRQLVGGLQYLCVTRPDICFAVNRLSQYMHSPSELHWSSLKRVLRYLKGTIYHGLFLNKNSTLTLSAFSDSDWGGELDTGRSTTGYVVYLGSNPISLKSIKQKSVSRRLLKPSTKQLLMLLLKCFGFKICC